MWRKPSLLVVIVLLTACAHARPSSVTRTDWASVMALPPETRIEVVSADGRRFSGILQSSDADQVILQPVSLALRRHDVVSVWSLGKDKSLLKGYLVGAAMGLAIGAGAHVTGAQGVIVPVVTTGVGSVMGAWAQRGWNGPKRTFMYGRN